MSGFGYPTVKVATSSAELERILSVRGSTTGEAIMVRKRAKRLYSIHCVGWGLADKSIFRVYTLIGCGKARSLVRCAEADSRPRTVSQNFGHIGRKKLSFALTFKNKSWRTNMALLIQGKAAAGLPQRPSKRFDDA
ncbi:MAG: hypothetical protein QXI12_03895 [Candidatus Methanomethyliaceae archaeon]